MTSGWIHKLLVIIFVEKEGMDLWYLHNKLPEETGVGCEPVGTVGMWLRASKSKAVGAGATAATA